MLRLFLLAMLAAIAMPANAAYFVEIEGSFTSVGRTAGAFEELEPYHGNLPVNFHVVARFDDIEPRSGFYEGVLETIQLGALSANPNNRVLVSATDFSWHFSASLPYNSDGIGSYLNLYFRNFGGLGDLKFLLGGGSISDIVPNNHAYISFQDPVFTKLDVDRELRQPVPEPATWALMLVGFGLLGGALRRQQRAAVAFA